VLASGRGSNFLALQRAIEAGRLNARIVCLLSDQAGAPALAAAGQHGIPAEYLPYDRTRRQDWEERASARLETAGAELVILAGFMRLVTPWLIQRFAGRLLNIHPSLLPAFKGLHAPRQALEYGVKITGCTVHLVTEEMDAGPILAQRAVPVLPGDTEDSLAARILEQEHDVYWRVVAEWADQRPKGKP
jgi:phosphoribosylglycinamide formyltransferase-1